MLRALFRKNGLMRFMMRLCDIVGCGKKHHGRGLCASHYQTMVRWGDPLFVVAPRSRRCHVNGCETRVHARGMCHMHYRRYLIHGTPIPTRKTIKEKFYSYVHKTDGCWEWLGFINNGYGQFRRVNGTALAHRICYEYEVGPIPKGLDIDHLCRNRSCVNPSHLEPVTRKVNLNRGINARAEKTRCPAGHPYSGDNLIIDKSGGRRCRECKNSKFRERYAKQKQFRWAEGTVPQSWINEKGENL